MLFLVTGLFFQAQTLKVTTDNIRLDGISDGENDWSHRKDYFASQIQFELENNKIEIQVGSSSDAIEPK